MTEATIRTANMPRPAPPRHVAQLDQLEQELRQAPQRQLVEHHQPTPLEHDHDLGKMSAEAVLAQYEQAASEFEIMGEEVKDRIDKLKASLAEADASMKLLTEAAKAIREKGKLAHAQIEEMSGVAKIISVACAEATKKITG